MNTRKSAKGSLVGLVLTGAAALAWTAAAQAQATAPTSSGLGSTSLLGGSSFGGGLGISGGMSLTGGTGLTGSTFGGGFSATGSLSGTGFTGTTGGTTSWRNGFSGSWVGSLTGGNSYRGALSTSGGASAAGISGTGTVSAFYPYYANPLAAGAPNLTSMPQFNQAVSVGSAAGSPQSGYGGGIGGGFSGYGANNRNSFLGGNGQASGPLSAGGAYGSAANTRQTAPFYTTSPGFDYRPAGPNLMQSDVQGVLARSSALSPNRSIRVAVEGPVVVLRGTVASADDRRLAEGLVRLTPGVGDVRNELTVSSASPRPGPGP